ncbi:MAG: hypothetical protein EOO88_12805 [Pedobacter sp.]|nr:MAG: hypothetical protein EOO88_12805 [Pedobacter sp.]
MNHKVITICLTVLSCLFLVQTKGFCQEQELLKEISTAITYLDPKGMILLESKKNLNRAFIFSVSISTDYSGKIEKITYSNQTATLDSIVNFSAITSALKQRKKLFLPFKNEVLVTTVLLQLDQDWRIDNVPEFRDFFARVYNNMNSIPKDKKMHLLPTINWLPWHSVE